MTQSMEAIEPRVELILKHPINPAHIPVDLALIVCIEPRFWNTPGDEGKSTIEAFRQHKQWNIVPLTEAGGIEILASEDPAKAERKAALLARIDQELNLHHPPRLGLSVHLDCGAYGYSEAFGNDASKEREKLNQDLRRVFTLLREKFGDRVKEFPVYVFTFKGVEEISF